jgi:hypothetical protein
MPSRMTYIRRRVVVLLALSGFVWVGVQATPTLAPPPLLVAPPVYASTKSWYEPTSTTVPQTTTSVLALSLTNFVCPDAVALGYSLGWAVDDLDELDYVIWRESRCLPHVHYDKDPNGGSHGLTQINGFWCKPSRWYPLGYLQTQLIASSCDDLYNPLINLLSALEIFNYSVVHNDGNGWQPWAMPKDFCDYVHSRCDPPAIVGG